MFLLLRTELNNLLFHYYNAIGILEREINNPQIENSIKMIANQIKKIKENIIRLINTISDEIDEENTSKKPEIEFFDNIPGFYE